MRWIKPLFLSSLVLSATIASAQSIVQPAPAASARQAASMGRLDHRELAADQQVIQTLNRLTFGPRPGDIQKVRSMGLDRWIDLQLHPDRIDDAPFERFIDRYDILKADQNELLTQYAEAQRERRMVKRARTDSTQLSRDDAMLIRQIAQGRRQVVGQIQSARVAHAVASNRQLQEVMTDFWLNHFNVFLAKGPPAPYYIVDYERDVIRPNALGKFRDLLEAVARNPAMLFYLDNARSMADSTRPRLAGARNMVRNRLRNAGLNENYGRELLELHTVGVDGGYTQQDVINVARALTGWTIRPPVAGGGFIFRPEMHDAGEKVVLGHKLAAGRGLEDGEDVLDIVSRSPATARFIATKLVRRFVADDPPEALVRDAAAAFTRTGGDIREVVRTIVTSNEFYSQRAFRSKVKSPFEVVVSAARALNAQPDSTPRTAQAIAYLGQPIYGHQAPNGYPETGEAWMNTGAILNRINFGMAVAANQLPGVTLGAVPGIDFLRSAPRAAQVDAAVSLLLAGSASPDTRAVLLKGENPLLANAAGNEAMTAMSDTVTPDDAQMGTAGNERRAKRQTRTAKNSAAGDDGMTDNQVLGIKAALGTGPRANQLARGFGTVPQLSGMAQIIGLALGSPEFQRR